MLIEVKSISDLSLLFGSTWLVNSVVITSVLVMILLANALVMRFRWTEPNWAYVGLAGCLVFSYWLRPDVLSGFGFLSKTIIGGTIAGLPLFFAGNSLCVGFPVSERYSSSFWSEPPWSACRWDTREHFDDLRSGVSEPDCACDLYARDAGVSPA